MFGRILQDFAVLTSMSQTTQERSLLNGDVSETRPGMDVEAVPAS